MELNNYKCSLEKHQEIDADSYCQDCKIYMCEKCENYHSNLFTNHHQFNLDKNKDINEVFTGLCKEGNHSIELEYYCKTHNVLCCSKCIAKIKEKGNGQHRDCDVCFIEDFENEKKEKLNENIKNLEDLLVILEKSIVEIKKEIEKMNLKKEELKTNIQKIFTQIRNAINEREDELFLEIENIYNFSLLDDEKIKKYERLPDKTKQFLKEVKSIEYDWKSNQLKLLVHNCINVENNAKEIQKINESNEFIKKQDSLLFFYSYEFIPKEQLDYISNSNEEDIDKLVADIKNFGILKNKGNKFDSNMIINEKEVKKWLNNKNFIAELLYRKTVDGSKPNDFHSKCDNKGITITFIQTLDNSVFGGYTEIGWEGKGAKKDNSTFIFNYNGKYKVKENKDCIYCDPDYGPTFGKSPYYEILFDNSLDKGETQGGNFENYSFFNNKKSVYENIKWDVKEIEVYKIIYI